MIGSQALAIVWAQWRSLTNFRSRSRNGRFPITAIFIVLWYGFWAVAAVALAIVVSDPEEVDVFTRALPGSLLLAFAYWQIVPVMLVSTGVSLDLSRLMVYPIPHVQLFTIEVLLRVTTCIEMLLLSAGLAIGLVCNPRLPSFVALPVIVFAAFNLFVSAGIKDLLGRLLMRRGVREATVFFIVILAALPQVLLTGEGHVILTAWLNALTGPASPWGATASLALGHPSILALSTLPLWSGVAWLFARSQFERTLRFDSAEAKAHGRRKSRRPRILDAVLRFASSIFSDPMAAMVEKEIRFLGRSARFRLLFFMGFSFGLLIWLPAAMRQESDSFFRTNYLTVVNVYALMLLGEVCFWNTFGFDRAAAQAYFIMPVTMSAVLRSKNVAAMFFVLLELVMVSVFCALLRMPVTFAAIAEAFCVTIVVSTFLMSFGNLLSVRYPRPIDPAQSWRSGTVGRSQAFLLFLYPAAAAPIILAFAAEFAFESRAAFYGVLLFDFILALVVYHIALESAVGTAEANKESIVMALSKAEGPVGT